MSQPEIFRRCTDCGASFREGALFCPQCGSGTTSHGFTEKESEQEISDDHVEDQEPVGTSGHATEQSHTAEELPVTPQGSSPNLDQTMPLISPPTSPAAVAQQALAAKASEADRPKQTRRPGGMQAPRSDRRVTAGVNKLRKGTSIVIDEAAIDPSLRFVLIAGFLFLLFIVLLVVSKWMN